jgi:3',5'-cyclic AMP phosphodiesterase CpdA
MDMEEYNRVQRDWLKDALAKSTAQWRFAMGHHPYVSNGLHGNAGAWQHILA